MPDIEQRTIGKVMWRLLPFIVVCYFIAYLDRTNVGFAKLSMDKDLGLTETMFGFGSGVFFFTYFLFEVPSNLALAKFGARRWIARIMVTWGIVSGMMAFIPQIAAATGLSTEYTFYGMRLLLGIAEAGFFPGIIFYLTLWFPAVYRARIIGMFMVAIPMSAVIGSPISGLLLGVTGLGLGGWQWLYIIEAVPALLLGAAVLFLLTDTPEQASWLAADERQWLRTRLAAEERTRLAAEHIGILRSLVDPRILLLALVYFGAVAGNYGVGFFSPTIVKGFGLSNAETGLVNAIPYLIGSVAMILFARYSDRTMQRRGPAMAALAIAAIGIGGSGVVDDPFGKMVLLSVGAVGVFGVLPIFWTLPTAFLSGASAAAGIAAINSLGNLSGFAGPYAMGYLKDATGNFKAGLLTLAGAAVVGLIAVALLRHNPALERAPAAQPAE
jgi:MFS family permease